MCEDREESVHHARKSGRRDDGWKGKKLTLYTQET